MPKFSRARISTCSRSRRYLCRSRRSGSSRRMGTRPAGQARDRSHPRPARRRTARFRAARARRGDQNVLIVAAAAARDDMRVLEQQQRVGMSPARAAAPVRPADRARLRTPRCRGGGRRADGALARPRAPDRPASRSAGAQRAQRGQPYPPAPDQTSSESAAIASAGRAGERMRIAATELLDPLIAPTLRLGVHLNGPRVQHDQPRLRDLRFRVRGQLCLRS